MDTNPATLEASRMAENAHPFQSVPSYVKKEIDIRNPQALLDMVSGIVAFRIENPKSIPLSNPGPKAIRTAKPAKKLSSHDREEIRGACAQAISQRGNWQTGKVDWKAAFNFSRRAIGLTRDAENHRCTVRLDATATDENGKTRRISETIPTPFPLSMLSPLPDLEADAIRRENLAAAIRRMRAACFASYAADLSRKRRASLKWQLATLRMISFQSLRYRGMTEAEISATGMRIKRFLDYAKRGFAIQSAARLTRGNWQPLETLAIS